MLLEWSATTLLKVAIRFWGAIPSFGGACIAHKESRRLLNGAEISFKFRVARGSRVSSISLSSSVIDTGDILLGFISVIEISLLAFITICGRAIWRCRHPLIVNAKSDI